MERRRWRWVAVALLGAGVVVCDLHAAEVAAPRHLAYVVAWNGIPAAHATIDVVPEAHADESRYTISGKATTNRFVDLFWTFRGDARATVRADSLLPVRFRYERRINSTPTVMWIDFEAASRRARSVWIEKTERREHDIDASGIVDPITAAFQALNADARVGDTLRYRVFTGETHFRVTLNVRGEETVTVPAGQFDALRIEPEVIKIKEQEKPDKRVRRAAIWVTRAPTRTILRIRSEIMVGAITLDLLRLDHES